MRRSQLINANQSDFIAFLQEGVEGGELGGEFMDQLGDDGEGGDGMGGVEMQVTEAERDAIERLVSMGFDRDVVIQTYFACDKNEELTAN